MFDDDIWDEERWESYLRNDDERVAHYMKIVNRFLDKHPPPRSSDKEIQMAWREAFKAYLIKYGWQSDELDSSLFKSDSTDLNESLGSIEMYTESEFEELSFIPVYREALSVTRYVLQWSDHLPGAVKDSTLVQFCASIMQITANIAKGHGMGMEREMIGGNIACLKRAIQAANVSLALLPDMKPRDYMTAARYRTLYEMVYELRNAIGIYIQDLRDRFYRGID